MIASITENEWLSRPLSFIFVPSSRMASPVLALILISYPAFLNVEAALIQPRILQSTPVPANGNASSNGGEHGKMVSEFLRAHNEVRAKCGEAPLRWNETLERYAEQWAGMRASDCKLVHAPNNQYGENLFWGKYKHWTAREVVRQWSDEAAFYNAKTYQCADGQQCGHYTQIVWRSSSWVGCAKQTCFNGEIFVVCEYFPAGNYLDAPDPFTAKTSFPGEENCIPRSTPPTTTAMPKPNTSYTPQPDATSQAQPPAH